MSDKSAITIFIIIVVLVLGGLGVRFFLGSNAGARRFGGASIIKITKGEKIVNVTWKDDNLWVLTRPARTDEKPETFTFAEKSNLGILQGTVVLEEDK